MSKFTNSPLVEYTHISPNRTSPRKQNSITKIIVHHMAGCLTLKQFDNIVSNPKRKMSSNYAIDKDAHVGLFCEEKDRCWCSSSPWADNRGIAIEVSNSKTGGNWPVSDKVYDKLIELCADICIRNDIEELKYTGDKYGSLVFHRFFAATLCLPTDTELLTPHGWVTLKKIKLGDTIATYNKDTNRIVFDQVQNKVEEYSDTVYDVGGLRATKNHNVIAVDGSGKPQFVKFEDVIGNINYYGYLSTDDLNINSVYIRKFNPEDKPAEYCNTEVSCVTVKSGYIVIRQNGMITIVGNCPGPYLFDKANDICERVNAKILQHKMQQRAEELANGGGNNNQNSDNNNNTSSANSSFTFTVKKAKAIYDTYRSSRRQVAKIQPGVYTIVDTETVSGVKYGKLKSGAGWIVLGETVVSPQKVLKVGSLVKISASAKYYNGASIPSWVRNQNWFVSSMSGNRVVLGKNEAQNRDIQSPIHKNYLTVIR